MIDNVTLASATLAALTDETEAGGVGTLGEKYVHKILKYATDPDPRHHEVSVCGCIADVYNEDGVTEIQTRSFERLVPKLGRLLPTERVCVVCPMPYEVRLCRIDPESGEITARKSPRRRGIYDAAIELYKLREFIPHEHLTVRILLLAVDEYRGAKDKRGRSAKINSSPTSLVASYTLRNAQDYSILLPPQLPEEFVASEYYRHIHSRTRYSCYALKLCEHLGLVTKIGKRGRAVLYRREKC